MHPEISQRAKAVFRTLVAKLPRRNFDVKFWDGEVWPASGGAGKQFTLALRAPEAVRQIFQRPGSLSFGEAYVHGLVDVEGALQETFTAAEELMKIPLSWREKAKTAASCLGLPAFRVPGKGRFGGAVLQGRRCSPQRRAQAINYHYDQPIEFWQLWLDESLCYSCAYFETAERSLEEAQAAKLEMICRKLGLRRGMRLLDMGCGWGALVCHAVKFHGVQAIGITLSPRQAEQARARAAGLGLDSRCEIRVADFRDFSTNEPFDCVSSVGAVEHIAQEEFSAYFRHAFSLLRPGGRFFNHGMAASPTVPPRTGESFLDRYVFPDYWLATMGETIAAAEAAGFEVLDIENLREHYALTLAHWSRRLEGAQDAIERLADPLTFRVFKLYLAGVEFDFRCGRINLAQTLLAKPAADAAGLPRTRVDWYTPPLLPP